MAHEHKVNDTDKPFLIIPQTRKIKNASGKRKLMQGDHKSEVLSFTMPRYVDGHDMLLCNVLEVHYNNISTDGNERKPNMDELTDIHINPDDESKVIFSWTITENATQLPGILSFFLRFACVNDDGSVEYNWHTESYDEITIGDVEYNDQVVIEFYADIIHTWKADIVATTVAEVTPLKVAAEEARQKAEQSATVAEQAAQSAAASASTATTKAGNAGDFANAAMNSMATANGYAVAAGKSAENAKASEENAKASETNAEQYAQRAEEASNNAAWVTAEIDENGHLIISKSDNFTGAEFSINENGHMEVAYK